MKFKVGDKVKLASNVNIPEEFCHLRVSTGLVIEVTRSHVVVAICGKEYSCFEYEIELVQENQSVEQVNTSEQMWDKCPTCSATGMFVSLGYVCKTHGPFG